MALWPPPGSLFCRCLGQDKELTDPANTGQQPSMALPFWVEDRTGKGEKRLCGCCWLRENFMGRTEAGTVDLVRLSGTGKEFPLGTLPRAFVSSGLQARLFLASLSGSKALVRTCFWYRLWQFLTHTMNSGWMWRLCSCEGQAGPLHCSTDFTVYISFSSHLHGRCCIWRGEWSHCSRDERRASQGCSCIPWSTLTSLSHNLPEFSTCMVCISPT